ncbi:MAG: NACHT domain-containing protein [Candidatus Aminicenantes bacterium]|nr:NACHT domain-containing protein [Candidatus Aminicenantes bacterium]NIQ72613.1 NACHT domain-containing protein [Candidatus Aminicenantes bacterium]NIT28647.1 NACHT domain-containing protein [Candidatus Aminicenantes bacterium]
MWLTKRPGPTYNPLHLSEQQVLNNFIARQHEFRTIFSEIKNSSMQYPEQHIIIQGQRGQGKSMLLVKLYREIKKDELLNRRIIPVIFTEEQYNVNSLFDFWGNTADYLEEEKGFTGLYKKIAAVSRDEEPESRALSILETTLKKKRKKLVLLVDNIDQILDKLTRKEQQRLREVLITCADIRIIGTAPVVPAYFFDYSNPFYEFFRIIDLKGLNQQDTRILLLKLGELYGQEDIQQTVVNEPARVETLRRLIGGNLRQVIFLFEALLDYPGGNAYHDMEFILDRDTPYYRYQMDNLSPLQQKIVHIIALQWDAVSTKTIAVKSRMQSKAVSSHLALLEKNRLVRKIKTNTKNHFYQLNERFFNLWYLVRYGRKEGKQRVQWLVHFLENWYRQNQSFLRANGEKTGDSLKANRIHAPTPVYMPEDSNHKNQNFQKFLSVGQERLKGSESITKHTGWIIGFFIFLMGQKHYYKLFEIFNENPFDLKERFKPIYYALMYFLKDEYPNESRKMGEELRETVEEIIFAVSINITGSGSQ